MNEPTVITKEDIDNLVSKMMNGDFDIKIRPCMSCSKDFYPNYDYVDCDECFFSRWPEEERIKFFIRFLT